MTRRVISLDINWSRHGDGTQIGMVPPHTYADMDLQAYLDYHFRFDVTEFWMPTSNWAGYAYYPTRLNCVAPGMLGDLFPRVLDACRERGLRCWGYFCVGADLLIASTEPSWRLPPTGEHDMPWPMLAPDSPWIDLVEQRIVEFLQRYDVDSIMLDWFVYGALAGKGEGYVVPKTQWSAPRFEALLGRPMPDDPAEITPEENLAYKRHVLGENARRLARTIRAVKPDVEVVFNLPYHRADDPMWVDHPVLEVSDLLFAESSDPEVVNWLLKVRRPEQRVMCMIHGRLEEGFCFPELGLDWAEKGCDLFATTHPETPHVRHHPIHEKSLEQVKQVYAELGRREAEAAPSPQPVS